MNTRFVVMFAALLLLAGIAPPLGAGRADAAGCADVHLLFARGTQEGGGLVGNTPQATHRLLVARSPATEGPVSAGR